LLDSRSESSIKGVYKKEERRKMSKGQRVLGKRALILAVVGLLAAAPAWASQIDFSGIGSGGTWSWNGSGPLTATALGVEVKLVGSPSTFTIGGSPETFTTGAFMGGSGTLSSPWLFGPGSPNSFTIMGCVPPATSCSTPATLFSGQFVGTEGALKGFGGLLFDAPDVTGTVNAGLLSYLGLPTTSTMFSGMFNFSLAGSVPGKGLSASGDLILGSPVPEPVSMLLVGSGLLVIALGFRLKKIGVRSVEETEQHPLAK
jgi:hypothetical protein